MNYEISAVVESSKWYSELLGFEDDRIYAKIAPVDLCLAWRKLAEPENERNMTFVQGKRNCQSWGNASIPVTDSYFRSHISNNHIIPATQNIINAIRSLKKRDKIVLKGYLVNVLLERYGNNYTFLKTSVMRGDWGLEGCEVIYVTYVRIGNKIYE